MTPATVFFSDSSETLPEPPTVVLEVVNDRSSNGADSAGFLHVRRLDVVAVRDEERSAPFAYDVLDRKALDAAVMVAHHVEDGILHVWLRSCVRPPLALRPQPEAGREDATPAHPGVLWEVPAGLIEPNESPRAAAARELEEELGFVVNADDLAPLGPWTVPAPGFVGEMQHFFHVRVDPATRYEPEGDGSALEGGAMLLSVSLSRALEACLRGEIRDAKTELALRRLADIFADATG